jgi:hypothetical protein
MTTPAHIKKELLASLVLVLDQPLKETGFVRKESSLAYVRTLNEAEQQIVFAVDYLPKYQPGAEAHIHPMLRIAMPKVSRAALDLVGGDKMLLADAPDVILNQPIDFVAPKNSHQYWYATGQGQFVNACESIRQFLWRWVLPFLTELSTPQELVKLSASNDERIMKQKHWYIFVAAAYQLMGQMDRAREITKQHLGSAGSRRRYAPLFKSLGIE